MINILMLLLTSIILSTTISSQDIVNQGKPITEIFTDFHYNLTDTARTTGFGLNIVVVNGYNRYPNL